MRASIPGGRERAASEPAFAFLDELNAQHLVEGKMRRTKCGADKPGRAQILCAMRMTSAD